VPTARRSRTIPAPEQQLWELLCDPHHLPRWWPRVTRVEDVEEDAFTEVMRTRKGKLVRADFSVRRDEAQRRLTWVQRIEGTPFASVLKSAETELRLSPLASAAEQAFADGGEPRTGTPTAAASGTEVTLELRQEMAVGAARYSPFMSLAPRFGGPLVRRAAAATLEQALDGLERISA
jgi:uncharacterized protein YndB with AHSA1/START domain